MADRSDNFIRPNNATAIGQPSDGGPLWTVTNGPFGIDANALYASASNAEATAVLASDLTDAAVACTLKIVGPSPGLLGRFADINNLILCQFTGGSCNIWTRIAGAFNEIASVPFTPANGAYAVLSVKGTTASAIVNNTTITSATVPASAGENKWGVWLQLNTTSRLTDFSISQNVLTIPTPKWQPLPQTFPVDGATVWVRRWQWVSRPYKATYSAATQQFTEYPAGTPVPWYFLQAWRTT